MPTVQTILAQAPICQYLAIAEYYRKMALKGGAIVSIERVGRLIYIVRKTLGFIYGKNPSDPNLVPTANYLYWLCGKYSAKAAEIINGGGTGEIINPSTGTASTILAYKLQFRVGDPGSPMVDGDTVLTIPITGAIQNSFYAILQGPNLPENFNDQISYSVDETSNPAQVTFTFNSPVVNGQWYIVRGLRLQAVASPATSETYFEVPTYAAMLALATGPSFLSFLVINDENKGLTNTRYEWWPGEGIKEWLAANPEP